MDIKNPDKSLFGNSLEATGDPLMDPPFSSISRSSPPMASEPLVGQRKQLDMLDHIASYTEMVIVVHGKAGSGKTHLAKMLAASRQPPESAFLIAGSTLKDITTIIEIIAEHWQLGEIPRDQSDRRQWLFDAAIQRQQHGVSLLMVIDQAEKLSTDTLSAIFSLAKLVPGSLKFALFGEVGFNNSLPPSSDHAERHDIEIAPLSKEDAAELIRRHRHDNGKLPLGDEDMDAMLTDIGDAPTPADVLSTSVLSISLPTAPDAQVAVSDSGFSAERSDRSHQSQRRAGSEISDNDEGSRRSIGTFALAVMVVIGVAAALYISTRGNINLDFIERRLVNDTSSAEDKALPSTSAAMLSSSPTTELKSNQPPVLVTSEQLNRQLKSQPVDSKNVSTSSVPASETSSSTSPEAASTTSTSMLVTSAKSTPTAATPVASTIEKPSKPADSITVKNTDQPPSVKDSADRSVANLVNSKGAGVASSNEKAAVTAAVVQAAEKDQAALSTSKKEMIKSISPSGLDNQRLLALATTNDKGFMVQLAGFSTSAAAQKFSNRWADDIGSAIYQYKTKFNGKDWFVVVAGVYSDRPAAERAVKQWPAALTAAAPWIRPTTAIRDALL